MASPRSRFTLPFALITAIFAVSTSSIFIRFAQEEAPSLVIAALRLTFATLLLAPVALLRHREELKSLTRTELLLGVFSGLFLAVHFATWISSLEYTTVASSVVFVSTGPLWVALLSPFFLNERITRAAIAGLIIAILGGIIIALSDACSWNSGFHCPQMSQILQGPAMWGNFLALAGAWAVSGYIIIGRKVRSKISLIPYIFMVYGISAIALLLMMFAAGESLRGYSTRTYGWIFLLALIPQLIGHSTYNWALRYLPASVVAITTLAEPVGSAVLAYFILSEVPTNAVLVGGAFILIGIYLAARPRNME
jgi:drug/metabolite transporter (DMT)-like permease